MQRWSRHTGSTGMANPLPELDGLHRRGHFRDSVHQYAAHPAASSGRSGRSETFRMVYIHVPDLTVSVDPQRYTCLEKDRSRRDLPLRKCRRAISAPSSPSIATALSSITPACSSASFSAAVSLASRTYLSPLATQWRGVGGEVALLPSPCLRGRGEVDPYLVGRGEGCSSFRTSAPRSV